jgi:tRNA pseudouridine55 synthase
VPRTSRRPSARSPPLSSSLTAARAHTELVGVLNVSKLAGWTSHDAVARVRRLAGQKRVGHAGTLDPLATGVLPVLLGRATRLADLVQSGRKCYTAVVRLGEATTTDDAEGEVIASAAVPPLTVDALDSALHAFRGEIAQTPPRYSAIKVDGQRAYAVARRGGEVALQPRRVTIHDLRATVRCANELQLDVTCSSGTYIRALARDLALALSTLGHLRHLVRTSVGPFCIEQALTLDEVEARSVAESLQPASVVLPHTPQLDITFEAAARLRNGGHVRTNLPPTDAVWVYDPERTLVCLGSSDGACLQSRILL